MKQEIDVMTFLHRIKKATITTHVNYLAHDDKGYQYGIYKRRLSCEGFSIDFNKSYSISMDDPTQITVTPLSWRLLNYDHHLIDGGGSLIDNLSLIKHLLIAETNIDETDKSLIKLTDLTDLKAEAI